MKKNSKRIRIILTTLFITIMIQGTVFAAGNENSPSSSSLSAVQIVGAVVLLLLAILVPLVRGSRIETSQK